MLRTRAHKHTAAALPHLQQRVIEGHRHPGQLPAPLLRLALQAGEAVGQEAPNDIYCSFEVCRQGGQNAQRRL